MGGGGVGVVGDGADAVGGGVGADFGSFRRRPDWAVLTMTKMMMGR